MNRRSGLTPEQLHELMKLRNYFDEDCVNGANCKWGNRCTYKHCGSKPADVWRLEDKLSRVCTYANTLLAQNQALCAQNQGWSAQNQALREQVKALCAQNKALRAQNKALRAQNKSPSKKSGKKSSGAGAAAVDNEEYPSVSTLSRIIYDILSDGNYMTCAQIGQAVMKHRDNPSGHTLTKMFFHLRKNNEIEGSPKSATNYISSLADVVEGDKSGTLKTFGLSVQEEDALGALFESAALDGEWPVAEVSQSAPFASAAPVAPAAPAAPVLKPIDSVLVVPPIAGIKSDGN